METDILENLKRKKRIKKVATIAIILILLVIVSVFIVFLLTYFQSPEKTLGLGANIESALLNEQRNLAYVKLLGGSDKNITKIKFIFTDVEGNEHIYETSEGALEISVPFKRSFWDWLFRKPAFEGKYDYEINSGELGLENFENINEVSVSFEYYEEGEIVETGVLDTKQTTTKTTTTGGGNGPSGNGGTTTCTTGEWINTNEYRCNETIRERKQIRSICPSGTEEQWIVEDCEEGEYCYDGAGAPADLCINNSLVCIDSDEINYYNKGNVTLDLLSFSFDFCLDSNVTEYYCYFNGTEFEIRNESVNCSNGCSDGACSLPQCTSNENCTSLNNICSYGVCNLTTQTCQQLFNLSTNICRAASGICGAAEYCTGSSVTCPEDINLTGSICRAAVGECDITERCTGTSATCPSNIFNSSGTSCSLGICDGNGKCVVVSENIYSTNEDTPIDITLNSFIIGNWTRTVNPSHGSIRNNTSLNNVNFINIIYTPNANYNGEDYFEYNVTDGVSSEIINVTIIINPVNDEPDFTISNWVALINYAVEFSLPKEDIDGDNVSYTITGKPADATFSNGKFSWIPDNSDLPSSPYTITITADDGQGYSSGNPDGHEKSTYEQTITITLDDDITTYYVNASSPSGGSGLSWANAFDSIGDAINVYGPGDNVLIADGNYGEVIFNTNVNHNHWTIFRAEDGHTPVFDRLTISGDVKRYIEFNNISIVVTGTGWGKYGVRVIDSDYIRLINLDIQGTWLETDESSAGIGIGASSIEKGVDNVLIEGCEIKDFTKGIGVSTYMRVGDNLVIRNNHVHHIVSSGITLGEIKNNGVILIEGNHIHNQEVRRGAHGSGLEIRASNVIVRGNIIHDFGNTRPIRTYGTNSILNTPGEPYDHSNMLFENNLVYDALNWYPVELRNVGDNFVFRNNTVIGKRDGRGGYGAAFWIVGGVDSTAHAQGAGLSIYNNILVGYFWNQLETPYQYTIGNNIIATDVLPSDPDYFEGSGNFFIGGALFDQYSYTYPDPDHYPSTHKQNLNDAYYPMITSDACNGTVNGMPGVAVGALPCICTETSQCEEVFGSNYICDVAIGNCCEDTDSDGVCDVLLTLSPFTEIWNWIKGLLTKETGQAILTGKITGNAVGDGKGENKTLHIILSVFVAIMLIIVVVIVKIKKTKKK